MAHEIPVFKRRQVVAFEVGAGVSVSAFCRRLGISTRSFHRLRAAASAGGMEAIMPASRAPRHPARLYDERVEEAIASWHRDLSGRGLPAGGSTIRFHMAAQGFEPLPSARTIDRVLARLGLSRPNRAKKPRSAYKRFARTMVNQTWQIDAMAHHLPDGRAVTIYHIVDDASRMCTGLQAFAAPERSADAITALDEAMAVFGRPQAVQSDNGPAFNTHRQGRLCATELHLAALGILTYSSRPGHPQTQGKAERAHQDVRAWLAAHAPTDLEALNHCLHDYQHHHNHLRPHQAHTPMATPAQAAAAMVRAPQPTTPIDPARLLTGPAPTTRTVRSRGVLDWDHHTLYLGLQRAGHTIKIDHDQAHHRLTLTDLDTTTTLTTIDWPPPTRYTNLTATRPGVKTCQKP